MSWSSRDFYPDCPMRKALTSDSDRQTSIPNTPSPIHTAVTLQLRHTKSFKGTWKRYTGSLSRGSAATLVQSTFRELAMIVGESPSSPSCLLPPPPPGPRHEKRPTQTRTKTYSNTKRDLLKGPLWTIPTSRCSMLVLIDTTFTGLM